MTNEVINSYRYLDNFNHLTFNINIDKKLELFSDHSTINTIIQNLIENAIKYSKREVKGTVDVKIQGRKNYTFIQVKDTGLGIRKKDKNKIFDMFFRAHHDQKGSGLGLYLLKSAVEKLDGKITLESDLHKGTTFKISLPYS